jgi:hypothetical protein
MMPRRRIAYAWLALGIAFTGALLIAPSFTHAESDQAKARLADRSDDIRIEFEQKLSEAVRDGKITVEQKDLLLAKHDEIQRKIDAIQKLPEHLRMEAMEILNEETRQWLKDKGLDTLFLRHHEKHPKEHHGFATHHR